MTTILAANETSVESLGDVHATVALVEANSTVAETAAMLRRIQLVSSLPVVMIGAEASDAELVELIEAGCGCVRRDAALVDLLDAIPDVCCGRAECSPYLAALVSSRIRELSRDLTPNAETPALTPREGGGANAKKRAVVAVARAMDDNFAKGEEIAAIVIAASSPCSFIGFGAVVKSTNRSSTHMSSKWRHGGHSKSKQLKEKSGSQRSK